MSDQQGNGNGMRASVGWAIKQQVKLHVSLFLGICALGTALFYLALPHILERSRAEWSKDMAVHFERLSSRIDATKEVLTAKIDSIERRSGSIK